MRRLVLFIAAAATMATACVRTAPRAAAHGPGEHIHWDHRISTPVYTFQPFKEAGWVRLPEGETQWAIAKEGASEHESEIIMMAMFGLPEDVDLAARVRDEQHFDAPRYQDVVVDVAPDASHGIACVRAHTRALDTQASVRGGGTAALTIETIALYCVHPDKATVGFMLGYSDRYLGEARVPDFEQRADALLASMEPVRKP